MEGLSYKRGRATTCRYVRLQEVTGRMRQGPHAHEEPALVGEEFRRAVGIGRRRVDAVRRDAHEEEQAGDHLLKERVRRNTTDFAMAQNWN